LQAADALRPHVGRDDLRVAAAHVADYVVVAVRDEVRLQALQQLVHERQQAAALQQRLAVCHQHTLALHVHTESA